MAYSLATAPKWLGTIFIAAGCVGLLVAAFSAWNTRNFLRRAARTEGVVVELTHGSAHPEIEFKLPSGEAVRFPANGFISMSKGEKATVLYLPEDPWHPRLESKGNLWSGSAGPALVGFCILCVGLFIRFWPSIRSRAEG